MTMAMGALLDRLRNPLIAATLYFSEDIEKWASGLRRIYEECQASHIEVEFNRVKTGFVVSFYRPEWEEGEGLAGDSQKTVEKTREKIVRLLKENSSTTTADLSEKTKVSPKGIEWHLEKLKREGILRRVGADKGGHWEVVG